MSIDIREAEPRSLIASGMSTPGGPIVEVAAAESSAPDTPAETSGARWHVLHTKARQEKAVARALHAAEIEHYLPLVSHVRYRARRKRLIEEPLFASYLFLHGPMEAAYFAVATKRVANIIRVADQGCFLNELEQIRRALHNGAVLRPDRYLEVGRRVRVTAGPFRDIEGRIEKRARPDRLLLQIAALGRATSLEIDADLLEPVDE